MTQEDFVKHFGSDQISLLEEGVNGVQLYLIQHPETRTSILTTFGLHRYQMPVHEMYTGRERNELCCVLPSYWDVNDNNANFSWTKKWLYKLAQYVQEKNTWFGPGHTFQCAEDFAAISPLMKQNHLMLVEPVLLKEFLAPIVEGDEKIHFLALLPIYGDEMDFKQAKGTFKLLKKITDKGHSEKLDDFRVSVLRSRMSLFRR